MSTVVVPVLKPLRYQGRSYVRGQMVKVEPVEALAMARRGEVSLSKGTYIAPHLNVQTRDLIPESPSAPTPRTRRAYTRRVPYKRRDLTAEPPTE